MNILNCRFIYLSLFRLRFRILSCSDVYLWLGLFDRIKPSIVYFYVSSWKFTQFLQLRYQHTIDYGTTLFRLILFCCLLLSWLRSRVLLIASLFIAIKKYHTLDEEKKEKKAKEHFSQVLRVGRSKLWQKYSTWQNFY